MYTNHVKTRVAVVHEWMTSYSGSERVVEQILEVFPDADLFLVADFLSDGERVFLKGRKPTTSFIQRLPFARAAFRNYLPLMPLAIEGFDLAPYDLIISSSHSVAKGILTGPDQLHICYCHTPIRYAWDLQHQYLREAGMTKGVKRALTRLILHYMRLWDVRTSNGVDAFIANSGYIARRIKKIYGRDAEVLYPPVDTKYFRPADGDKRGSYYFTASRLVPYKRVEIIIEAFAKMPDRRLLVVGDGPQMDRCRKLASPNVEILGYQSKEKLLNLLQGAKAFVFAAEEDFGISIVEAQACGVPVICFGRGGATESVIDKKTGVFFDSQTPESISDAVRTFEGWEHLFNRNTIRRNAERFSAEEFRLRFAELVADKRLSGREPKASAVSL